MDGFQNRRRPESQKQLPGCMGRMMNMFDLSAGMPGTKLLTDRAHRDGSPTRRYRSDPVKKLPDPVGVHIENKTMINESRQSSPSKKSGATPVKMLIAQEMSKETESKRRPPSVVAKLMGLEALPLQQPLLTNQRILYEDYSYEGAVQHSHQEEDVYFSSPLPSRTQSYVHEKEYKDVYEVWQQPSRITCIKDQLQQRGRSNENSNEKRMALVRQKFMEAKRLATDEKLLHSKEFQDALEVLSSNRDLFLKFLEEPNSLFYKHQNEIQTVPPPAQTRRITVLKPSKAIEEEAMNQARIRQSPPGEERIRGKNKHRRCSSLDNLKTENLSQPTRIVVLKPSPGKGLATNRISSPKSLDERDLCRNFEADEAIGSRDIAKEITRQMRESVNSNRRDDSLLSSVLSNGYVGDESSFNRSEQYIEEAGGNLSDSEIVTPTSRCSWDYMNRYGSPYSFSSISRASYSPESSVIREAKKRLSERWALVASNGVGQEQTQVRRSSSTLGEMLSISEVKKEEENAKGLDFMSSGSCSGEGDLKTSAACLSIGRSKDAANGERSPMNLSRSKSVPVSSSTYENIELNVEVSDSPNSKPTIPTEEGKSKNGKSSFKGKVSSLFFSRNKKSGKEKSIPSLAGPDVRFNPRNCEVAGKDDVSKGPEERSVNPVDNSAKIVPSLEKAGTSESPSENQEQPSPVSVLEAKFEDDSNSNVPQSSKSPHVGHLPEALSRSPPIESLARSISWDDTYMETSTINPSKLSKAVFKADEEEEERNDFVHKLLSSNGLDNKNSKTVFSRWHSLESPLDQMLVDSFLDQKDDNAKCKRKRSTQRLLFDSVNAALLEIGRTAYLNAYPQARSYVGTLKDAHAGTSIAEEVSCIINNWFSGDGKWLTGEAGNSSVIVDGVVRKEVVGREWTELIWWELDEISNEIGGKVLEQLVGEALSDLIDGYL